MPETCDHKSIYYVAKQVSPEDSILKSTRKGVLCVCAQLRISKGLAVGYPTAHHPLFCTWRVEEPTFPFSGNALLINKDPLPTGEKGAATAKGDLFSLGGASGYLSLTRGVPRCRGGVHYNVTLFAHISEYRSAEND